MKFACHMARALSRVAMTILVGLDELGIITMKKSENCFQRLILACQAESRIELHMALDRMCIAEEVTL